MSALFLAAVLGLPLAAGWGLLRALGLEPRDDRLAWTAWAWMAGSAATALLVAACLWARIPLRPDVVLPLGLLLAAGTGLAGRAAARRRTSPPSRPPRRTDAESRAFLVVVTLCVAWALHGSLTASTVPVTAGDEAHLWAGNAKEMYVVGGYGAAYAEQLERHDFSRHEEYPHLNKLLQVWVFASAGGITHVENRAPIHAFSVALLLLVAAAARRHVRPAVAAVLAVAVATTFDFLESVRWANSDALVAAALVLLWDAWDRWARSRRAAWLALAGIAAGVLAAAKNEGQLHLLCLAGALVLGALPGGALRDAALRRALLRSGPWLLLPPLGALVYLRLFNARFALENRFAGGMLDDLPVKLAERLGPVASYFRDQVLLDTGHTRAILPVFVVLALLFPRRSLSGARRMPAAALAVAAAGFAVVFLLTPMDVQRHLDTAARRIVWQLVPAMAVWIALWMGDVPRIGVDGSDERTA